MDILVGCDPEIFVKRKKDGHYVSAHNMVPGTKAEPYKVKCGAVQVDGMALEFNIDPAKTADEFLSNINTVMQELRKMVPDEYEFALDPTATFTKDHFDLQPDEAKELGCEPDFNAYTMGENPRPDNQTTMRTASGHVHLGFTQNADISSYEHMLRCSLLVKHLDAYLGVPSLLFDKDQKRRTMYGQAGAFRPKTYGCEYRVLSNKWLSSPDLIKWVFNQSKAAIDSLLSRKGVCHHAQNMFAEGYLNYLNCTRKNAKRYFSSFTGIHPTECAKIYSLLPEEVK